jgi:hypothetical protein
LDDMADEPFTGMDTGSESGAPGEHLPDPPLSADEQRLLADLRQPGPGRPVEAVEDSPAAVEAAEDDAPLPAEGGDQGDADAAHFRAPGD